MGAGQSRDDADTEKSEAQVKTSYYELLGIERQATEEQIKKAYRRKALELHPDRNYGNEEQATTTFAEVQSAYEILSDPQERAWYDSHEAAILRGDDGTQTDEHSYENIRVTTADDLARMLRKFNSNVEFTDTPSGFFGFLREQFEHLAKEEEVAAVWESAEAPEYPPFGHKGDSHDDVVKTFYAAWSNFSTVKSFAWKDKYRLSEAPDRRIRRLMEKENNSMRQEAIKEFNEAVRAFVLFVRKRDPRYQPSTQSEAERQQMLRDAAAAQRARARAANQAKADAEVPEWTKIRDQDEPEISSEEEVVEEILKCVACNKSFKSERQFEAHERSKKHQKAVQALQRKMQKENKHLQLDDELELAEDSSDTRDWEIIGEADDEDAEARPTHVVDSIDEHATSTDASVGLEHEDSVLKSTANHGPDVSIAALSDSNESDDSAGEVVRSIEQISLQASEDDEPQMPTRKVGKAAQKRAKKAAAAATTSEHVESNHNCATCHATFPSRTRLFQHIKDHGHAAIKTTTGGSKTKKGKGKR